MIKKTFSNNKNYKLWGFLRYPWFFLVLVPLASSVFPFTGWSILPILFWLKVSFYKFKILLTKSSNILDQPQITVILILISCSSFFSMTPAKLVIPISKHPKHEKVLTPLLWDCTTFLPIVHCNSTAPLSAVAAVALEKKRKLNQFIQAFNNIKDDECIMFVQAN